MIKVIKKRISKKRFIKIDFKDLRKGDIFYSYVGSEDPVKDPNKLTLFTATEDWSFIPGKTARIPIEPYFDTECEVFKMYGADHYTNRVSNCCSGMGKNCSKCGGFMHYQPTTRANYYYECEDCHNKYMF